MKHSSRANQVHRWLLFLGAALLILLTGCMAPQVSQGSASMLISIEADGKTIQASVPAGSTVQKALDASGVALNPLDRADPPAYTLLSEGDTIHITRVREEFSTRQEVLPFERQTVRNESMPIGETRLIQPGINGTQEITSRKVYEEGRLTSESIVKTVILQAAVPEIVMVGVQTPFVPIPIPGKLAYIASGNAWLMESSTANRKPIVTSGDLDGRVLRLSPDGEWLLYTRKSTKPADEEINTLWAYHFSDSKAKPINLRVSNIIHFADWVPGATLQIVYSTVEPRLTAPGWQANNDLFRMKFSATGSLGKAEKIVDANTGGVYGWWGTNFAWSPDGKRLAYSRPDGLGLVSFVNKDLLSLMEITPLQTHSDWALIPGMTWGADSRTLYIVTHAPPTGLVSPEESPYFDLSALQLDSGADVRIVRQSGMFAYPSASFADTGGNYLVAYLQALSPAQSDTSGYRLFIMDRDGSNRQALFPVEGATGLEPQTPVWAPSPLTEDKGHFLAVIYQGNLYLIDIATGDPNQVTGDGLIQKIDWK